MIVAIWIALGITGWGLEVFGNPMRGYWLRDAIALPCGMVMGPFMLLLAIHYRTSR